MVASQLNDHVSSNIHENFKQPAYKLDHSTKTALLSIKNNVHYAARWSEILGLTLVVQF